MLLSDLGVPDAAFLKMQNRLLQNLDASMREDGAEAALNLLYASGCGGSADHRLRSPAPMTDAAMLFRAGLTCTNCEHLYDLMSAFRLGTLRDLMDKTRIPVDRDHGMVAVGVMDEAGVLAPNELFLQFTDPVTGQIHKVEGPVLVGRSPGLHPGDIQPVTCVDNQELRHLVDVVVFPNNGRRSLPSMLSGGDLDGDLYHVIWDKSLLPEGRGHSPMNYQAPDPVFLDRDVEIEDVQKFFVTYIENDNLGKIATSHVAYADREKLGIRSPKCLEIARLHSKAVDFAKTGVSAHLPGELRLKNEVSKKCDSAVLTSFYNDAAMHSSPFI